MLESKLQNKIINLKNKDQFNFYFKKIDFNNINIFYETFSVSHFLFCFVANNIVQQFLLYL